MGLLQLASAPRCTWSPCSRTCRCRRPPTASTSCAASGLPVGGVVVNLTRRRRARRPASATRRSPASSTGDADRAPTSAGVGVKRRPRRWSTGCSTRPASTPSGARSRTSSASGSTSSTCRPTSCRGCPTASTSAALYELAAELLQAGHGMNAAPTPASARWSPAREGPRRSTSTRCSPTRPPTSSCAAAPAASARPRRRRRWRCAPPSRAARSSCSPSTRPAGWRSRWASRSSTTSPGRCPASTRRRAARSTR